MNKKQMGIVSGFFIVVTSLVMFYVHRKIPFMMDDMWYSTNLATGEPLQGFGDIVESQVWHFNNWGGRTITHAMLQMILMGGELFADILNVVATLVLAYMICVIAEARSLWAILGAMTMMLAWNANWLMSMFWEAGAANYLYITSFILLFLWCYLRDDTGKRLYGITCWIIPLGMVAGWSNENMGPMAWVLSLIVIIEHTVKKVKVRLWMILGNISCLLGSVLVVAAPGNFVRSEQVESLNYGVLWQFFLRCYAESNALLTWLFPTVLITVVLIFISVKFMQIEIGRKNYLLLLGAVMSWGAMVLSPHYPDRATFGTMILLICVAISLLQKMYQKSKDMSTYIMIFIGIMWIRGMFFLGEYVAVLWGWIK